MAPKELVLFVDFETRSRVDITTQGSDNYCSDGSTEIILMAYKFSNSKKIDIWEPSKKFSEKVAKFKGPIVAHNWAFEHGIFHYILVQKKLVNKSYSDVTRYRCTAATARRYAQPGSLDKAGLSLNIKNQKRTGSGRDLILRYSKPDRNGNFRQITKENWLRWKDYATTDILACEEIYKGLPKLHLDSFEGPVFEIDKRLNWEGVRVDSESLHELNELYLKAIADIGEKAEKLCGKEKSGALTIASPLGFKNWLNRLTGAELEDVMEPTLQKILQKTKSRKIKQAINYRFDLASAAPKKLEAMLNTSDSRGIARHFLAYAGAHTLRWAGRGMQIQNFPRDLSKDWGKDFQSLKKGKEEKPIETISKLLRGCIIPREGNVFIVGDLASIEARVLFYLAECETGLDHYRANRNIYLEFGHRIFKYKIEKGTSEYQIAKSAVLGLGYGMGPKRFYDYCIQSGSKITKTFAENVVNLYRTTFKEVPKYWSNCQRWVRECIISEEIEEVNDLDFNLSKNKLWMSANLPSGRKHYYYKPRVDEEHKILSTFPNRGEQKLWGGIIVENLVQATARDIIADLMIKINQPENKKLLSLRFTVHDEIVCEAKKTESVNAVKRLVKIMTTAPEWLPNFPLGAECQIMERYGK